MMITITIAIAAILTSFFLAYLHERFGNRSRMKEIQNQINKINKEYREAVKSKDERRIKEMEEKMKDFPKLMSESMMLSFKGLIVVLPVIIVIPMIVRMIFPEFSITLPFEIPIPFRDGLLSWRDTFGSYGWFWICLVFLGGASQIIYGQIKKLLKIDTKKEKKEKVELVGIKPEEKQPEKELLEKVPSKEEQEEKKE